jgi:hypothetical protein
MEAMQIATLENFSDTQETPEEMPDEELSEEEEAEVLKLTDVMESMELGKPLSDEHKKKISEALSKGGIKTAITEGDDLKSQSDFVESDSRV